ncbi:hypothetical protein SAMN04489867_3235 [Pedococcus dokdonensis]|uniref:Uncharacterized protein n=1 Tax=Pedococcus dokdonensis TaxID=443156 RepID=A0A1H0UCA4_9MICO|nr:hypothetical protein [Pedococcus dokdonensis]SDP63645.1 hypothetical protein SAMN04489867_3235 [Pedococcus dokdonensis]
MQRLRFTGAIAGVGSTSGVRFVVGRWTESPLGSFADVMVEDAAGHRTLLAPDDEVADFVQQTYAFDEVVTTPVSVQATTDGWDVQAEGALTAYLALGPRMPLGWLLRAVPPPVAASPAWATLIDPVAKVVMRGVRTRGTALEGRREWYGATDLRSVSSLGGSWRGTPLGRLADVDPPCRFGFSSTPTRPSVTSVVTTVELLGD